MRDSDLGELSLALHVDEGDGGRTTQAANLKAKWVSFYIEFKYRYWYLGVALISTLAFRI